MPRTSYGLPGKEIKELSDERFKFKVLSNRQLIHFYRTGKFGEFKKPTFQRDIEEDKVNSIISVFQQDWNKCKKSNYFNQHGYSLSICVIKNKYDTYWIIDGQHRLSAIIKLGTNYEFNVLIRLNLCENVKDVQNDFKYMNINSNIPNIHTAFEKSLTQNSIHKVKDYLKTNFIKAFNRSIPKKGKKSTTNRIHINTFMKVFNNIDQVEYLYTSFNKNIGDSDFIVERLLNINNTIAQKINEFELLDVRDKYILNKDFALLSNIKEGLLSPFYLTLRNFHWKEAFFNDEPIHFLKLKKNKTKKKIKSAIREKVLDRDFGEEYTFGKCFVCNNKLKRKNAHMGHIIPESKGGCATVENLKAICSNCNTSMGTENLIEFKRKMA